jgi:hypothetical protein
LKSLSATTAPQDQQQQQLFCLQVATAAAAAVYDDGPHPPLLRVQAVQRAVFETINH